MKHILPVVLTTTTLDAIGIALVLPIMPALLRDVGASDYLAWQFGLFISVYALMQFLCAPALGALSDRYGRRRMMLISLTGQLISYLSLTLAPTFGLLLLARAVAGISGASTAVASAYIADITPEAHRARRFGQLGASIGLGYIAGPVIGGALGNEWVRLPFIAAALLASANLVLAYIFMREPLRTSDRLGGEAVSLNPLSALRWANQYPSLRSLLFVFGLVIFVGEIGGTIWALYGEDKFRWSPSMIGVSLACFGVFHSLIQALLAGPLVERFGERRTLIVSMIGDSVAYILIALASSGWVAFALLPLFCLGGLASPALQSMLSVGVAESHQGRLQGLLASITGLVSILGPLLISTIYMSSRISFPGLVWVMGAALYGMCLAWLFIQLGLAQRLCNS